MGYGQYVFVSLIEGTLFYLLMRFLLKYADIFLPPLGSSTFLTFLAVWPFAAVVVRPGLQTIPIIGEIFAFIEEIAKSGLRKNNSKEKPQ